MKKINLLLIALFSTMALTTMNSCSDPCKDVTCENAGTCNDEGLCECADTYFGESCETNCVNGTYDAGTCGCDACYEGDACDVESRADMIGTYSGSDACSTTGATAAYNSTVAASSASASADGILVTGLWDGFFINTITATVAGVNITIPNQEPDSDGYTIQGSGIYTDGTIAWTFTVTEVFTNGVDQCTMSAVKQ